jgi:antitoxin component HigA of HigAB toxin-antitoxin module
MNYYFKEDMRQNFLFFFFIPFYFFLNLQSIEAKQWDPRLLQASRLAYQGNYQQAESLIDTYIQEDSEDPNGLFIKATVLEWKATLTAQPEKPAQQKILEIYKEANQLAFQNWNHDPENVDFLIDLGNSYLFLGRKYAETGSLFKAVLTAKKCQRHLEKALKLDPTRVDGLLALGAFHYLADNTPKELAVFKAILGIKGSKTEGLAELQKALTGDHPFTIDTQFVLLFIYMDYEKNYDQALKILGELEKQFPENPEMKLKRARIYEKQDKLKGANGFLSLAQWCEQKQERCHQNYLFQAYYNAGRLFKDLEQNSKAKELFAKALNHDAHLYPTLTAEAFYWPGLIDQAEGNDSEALKKFKQAQSISGISKKFKKEIEQALESICKKENSSVKC